MMSKIINKKNLEEFCDKINYNTKNYELLQQALIHRSFINEDRDLEKHNERLEFLGDAVLELIVTKFLFENYPDRPEGDLTSFRAALVKTESLAESAAKFQLGEYIYMSKGEESTGGRKRPYILANTFEALLGFIYLDKGFDTATKFVHKHLTSKIHKIVEHRLDIDNKSKLQEIAQEIFRFTPNYILEKEEGPDHEKKFTMKVMIDEKDFGSGVGSSKQEAEQAAAGSALKNWEKLVKKYNSSN